MVGGSPRLLIAECSFVAASGSMLLVLAPDHRFVPAAAHVRHCQGRMQMAPASSGNQHSLPLAFASRPYGHARGAHPASFTGSASVIMASFANSSAGLREQFCTTQQNTALRSLSSRPSRTHGVRGRDKTALRGFTHTPRAGTNNLSKAQGVKSYNGSRTVARSEPVEMLL